MTYLELFGAQGSRSAPGVEEEFTAPGVVWGLGGFQEYLRNDQQT